MSTLTLGVCSGKKITYILLFLPRTKTYLVFSILRKFLETIIQSCRVNYASKPTQRNYVATLLVNHPILPGKNNIVNELALKTCTLVHNIFIVS